MKVPIYKRKKRPYNNIQYSISNLRQCPNRQFQSVTENYNITHILYRYCYHIIVFKLKMLIKYNNAIIQSDELKKTKNNGKHNFSFQNLEVISHNIIDINFSSYLIIYTYFI